MPHDLTQIRAILGPTNTGKTHIAMERLLAHPSGMIGFPLRLLAREIYDRLLRGDFGKVHTADIALITGEEKIIPPDPRYFICTVEAMPVSRPVDFIAVDEIQLATDPERGHVFTDRLLHARGTYETLFLGAETMRGMIATLLPDVHIETRSRFSALRWTDMKKLSRLPRRSAIAAFSVENVYALAEIIRQQKGGAAVVMGALSPRTRNAQVELYQSGAVDYLVATDAIGMGLNMDIDHVAFAQIRKFDGRSHRQLTPAELAQIAGRAGRHTRDGSFGLTGEAAPLDDEIIARIENHEFEPIKSLMWRNRDLDFTSIDSLIISLEAPAPRPGLMRAPASDDLSAIAALRQNPDIRDRTQHRDLVALLWDVAQIPDFRKTLGGDHAGLIHDIFLFLTSPAQKIDPDWLATRIDRCDNDEGDLDTLSTRLAHIRTWNYVAHKTEWVADGAHWQERGRQVEERLSDALHIRLTKQFVDRKSSSLLKKLNEQDDVLAEIEDNGDITIGNEYAGRVIGLTLQRDPRLKGPAIGMARRAVEQRAGMAIRDRAQRVSADADTEFNIDHAGDIIWGNAALARLQIETTNSNWIGTAVFMPHIRLNADDMLNGDLRKQVETRLLQWARQYAEARLSPLQNLQNTDAMTGQARGLAFRLYEAQGSLPRSEIRDLLSDLDQPTRGQLRKCGVRFGAFNIYVPDLLKPAAAQFLALCASLALGRDARADHHRLPRPSLTSVPRDPDLPDTLYRAIGFHPFRHRAIRFDMLERLADLIRAARQASGGFAVSDAMLSIMGCGHRDMEHILRALGYEPQETTIQQPTPPAPLSQDEASPLHMPVDKEPETPEPETPEPKIPGAQMPDAPKVQNTEPATVTLWHPRRNRPSHQRYKKSEKSRTRQPNPKKTHQTPANAKSLEPADNPKNGHSGNGTKKAPPHDRAPAKKRRPESRPIDPDSPFAALAQLKLDKKQP